MDIEQVNSTKNKLEDIPFHLGTEYKHIMRTGALWIPASVTGMACFHSYTLVTHYNFFTLNVLYLM